MKPFIITTIVDVIRHLQSMYDVYELNFHPDDNYSDYVDNLGNNAFTDEEALMLDLAMERCFFVCEDEGFDLYELGNEIQLREYKKRGILPQDFGVER